MRRPLLKAFLATTIVVSSIGSVFAEDESTTADDNQPFMTEVSNSQGQAQVNQDAAEKRREVEWQVKEAQYQQHLAELQRQNEALLQGQQPSAKDGLVINTYPSVVGYPGYAGNGGYSGCNGYLLPSPVGLPYAPYGIRRIFHVSGNTPMPF